jgi:hypothetical protein
VPEDLERQERFGDVVRSFIAFHLVRWYPTLVGLLPRHRAAPGAGRPTDLAQPARPRRTRDDADPAAPSC